MLTLALLTPLLGACQSRAERAGAAAMRAEAMMQQGNLRGALENAIEATTLNDDLAVYWLLLARIQQASNMSGGAYDSYQKVLESDPYNLEALNTLSIIALNTGRADDLDRFADRLLTANPADRNGLTFKAGAAVLRRDARTANGYLDGLLANDPADFGALILKARLLAQSPKTTGQAATLIERSLENGGEPLDRLRFLQGLYRQQTDRPALRRTLVRIVEADPRDANAALALADLLYADGDGQRARALIATVMESARDNVDAASTILELWRDHGDQAMPVSDLLPASRSASLRMKGILARRANDLGRPDIAVAILSSALPGATVDVGNADARAALADALALSGRLAEATRAIEAVLAFDGRQPAALAVRARLAAAAGRFPAAIADARTIVADDPGNVSARLLLGDVLLRSGDSTLGAAALREGMRAVPDSTRMALRLASYLQQNGDVEDAADVLRELTARAPLDLDAWRARQRFCTGQGNLVCAAQSAAALARLQRA